MRTRVVTVVIICFVLFSSIGILSLNADSKTRIENHFYDYCEVKSGTDAPLICYYSEEKGMYQVRDAKSFKLIHQGAVRAHPFLLDDHILWLDDENNLNIEGFDGANYFFEKPTRVLHIIWDEQPVFVTVIYGEPGSKSYIKAVKEKEILWEAECDGIFENKSPNNPIWVINGSKLQKINPIDASIVMELEGSYFLEKISKEVTIISTFTFNVNQSISL